MQDKYKLTEEEKIKLKLIIHGKKCGEIGRILEKLGVKNEIKAAIKAIKENLVY